MPAAVEQGFHEVQLQNPPDYRPPDGSVTSSVIAPPIVKPSPSSPSQPTKGTALQSSQPSKGGPLKPSQHRSVSSVQPNQDEFTKSSRGGGSPQTPHFKQNGSGHKLGEKLGVNNFKKRIFFAICDIIIILFG